MRYAGIERCSLVNGSGCRVVLYTQGCGHNCKGCQNPDTHDCNKGYEWNEEAKKLLFEYLSEPYIKGITLSGGDPLFKTSIEEVGKLVAEIKEIFSKDIWLYTGYTWEEISKMNLSWLPLVDVICDGKFELNKRNVEKHYVGSDNQRVLDVVKTIAAGKPVIYCD